MEIIIQDHIQEPLFEAIEELEKITFPDSYRRRHFRSRFPSKKNPLCFFAFEGENLIAYKVGYEFEPDLFYSWVGGVHPNHRRQGLAAQLMESQHKKLKELGYKRVRTKTRNYNNPMIMLNLKSGFEIIGTNTKAGVAGLVILMEKTL